MTTAVVPADASTAKLFDVQAVATLLGISPRTVYRLSDAGRMPAPVKLGALVRGNRAALVSWIADGWPRVERRGAR